MKVTRKLWTPRPDRPASWITTVSLDDGRHVSFYGERLSDDEAIDRMVDMLEAPEG